MQIYCLSLKSMVLQWSLILQCLCHGFTTSKLSSKRLDKKKYCFGVNNCKLGVKYFLIAAKMSRPIRNDGKDFTLLTFPKGAFQRQCYNCYTYVDLPDDIINILSKKCLPWLNKTNVFLNRFSITDWISRRKALIIVYTLMEYQYFSHSKTWCPARN